MPMLLLCLRSSDPELTEMAIREAVAEIYPEHVDYEITGIARPARSQHVIVEISLPDDSADCDSLLEHADCADFVVGPGVDRSRGEPLDAGDGAEVVLVHEPEVPSR